MIDKELLYSPARKDLSYSAYVIYNFLRSKTIGTLSAAIDIDIKYSYSNLVKDSGICIETVRTCIIGLENKGFIDLKEQGGLKSGGKSCNIYRLSMRFLNYGTAKFEPGTMKKQHGLRTHCGFAAMHNKKTKRTYKK